MGLVEPRGWFAWVIRDAFDRGWWCGVLAWLPEFAGGSGSGEVRQQPQAGERLDERVEVRVAAGQSQGEAAGVGDHLGWDVQEGDPQPFRFGCGYFRATRQDRFWYSRCWSC